MTYDNQYTILNFNMKLHSELKVLYQDRRIISKNFSYNIENNNNLF